MKQILFYFVLILNLPTFAQEFKYLGGYDSQGVPDYLEPINDEVSPESMDMIANALPEYYPVPDYNPHYISSGYDTNIELQEDANVWVTFVKEGAGYKNVLGFYTYDINDSERKKPLASDITIIFPNASEGGYGGGLRKGNKVRLGQFKAGTGIGWVLLANAWNGSKVTWGHWQVYSDPQFNPETDEELTHHTVLLTDLENERIYLGFEDVRRDYASCDQDFNDAIFFVTTDPFTAIRKTNLVDITSATEVSSANEGGLESNGKLAGLIAERNFGRLKNASKKHKREKQIQFKQQNQVRTDMNGIDLSSILPETGMYATETARISSPEDLMGITNAKKVFSADYYEKEKRVAAALLTKTENGIYDHSKVICDRLNSSSLEDIRTYTFKGYELILIEIFRASGETEFAVNFSVRLGDDPKLYSYWNITDYPQGDYINFQVWGSSMGQVSSITGHIIDKLNAFSLMSVAENASLHPTVFVKSGFYKDRQLHLVVKNKNKDAAIRIDGNFRTTETDTEIDFSRNVSLSTDYEEELIIESGQLFDVGMQIKGEKSPQPDHLYLADGPWGIDYNEDEATIQDFSITTDEYKANVNEYRLERNINSTGKLKGTANFFRSVLAGDQVLDASEFKSLQFGIKNNLPVEVILVTEDLSDWNTRYRFKLEPNAELRTTGINLSDFKNGTSAYNDEKVKAVVFSIAGNYTTYTDFKLEVNTVAFSKNEKASGIGEGITDDLAINHGKQTQKAYNYPNPFSETTTLISPVAGKTAELIVYDLAGRQVYSEKFASQEPTKEFHIQFSNGLPGLYKGVLIVDNSQRFNIKLIVRK